MKRPGNDAHVFPGVATKISVTVSSRCVSTLLHLLFSYLFTPFLPPAPAHSHAVSFMETSWAQVIPNGVEKGLKTGCTARNP
jgi:hypothetical protein